MADTNHERVGKALTALRDGLLPGLTRTWAAFYGDDWVVKVNDLDTYPEQNPSPDDVYFLLKGVWNSWHSVFKRQFGHAERNFVSELREARNRWAHNEKFSSDDTYRVLDSIERLLGSFAAGEAADDVRVMKQDLLRRQIAEQARSVQRKAAATPTQGQPSVGLAPWREVVTPHPDVASGRFKVAEFAADLHQVAFSTNVPAEYADPKSFFRRTFITEGLHDLFANAARRLSGQGGDPVVDLQTNFGGGKTHSLIALYHMASGAPASTLPGLADLLEEEELELPTDVKRAVFVGQMVNPAEVRVKDDGTEIRTLWGEIAWQLGGRDAYELVADADRNATNPGERLIELMQKHGPALILIDEWVAYARQLPRDQSSDIPAGAFDTQFTFAQALTEAAAAVDNALVVVSVPVSSVEVGGDFGVEARDKLKNVIARKATPWRPANQDESFEIVRRRLFEPIEPDKAKQRDAVVKAFSDYYKGNSDAFPSECKEGAYRTRMEMAYPIHPELFDRLYEDWSTLDRFQRTRGVLRLMATVISELWARNDSGLMILPGMVPIDEHRVQSELTNFLDDSWSPIIGADVDGPTSLPFKIDQEVSNLGRYSAARRVGRSVYLGSAPREEGRRGIDIKHITLGSAQPGESPGTFADALRRVSNDATYMYVDGNQYWYSLQANVTRIAADRAASNFTDDEADSEIKRRLLGLGRDAFVGLHVFPDGPGDVVDEDDGVRLVLLPMSEFHTTNDPASKAIEAARAILEQRQGGPRINRNMLVFCAADNNRVEELRQAARLYLSWDSIVADRDELQLNPNQEKQAKSKREDASKTVDEQIGEAFAFILTPTQKPGAGDIEWETTPARGEGTIPERVAKKLESIEQLITSYAGVRIRMDLDKEKARLWEDDGTIKVQKLWSYYAQYLYLPRLASFGVLSAAIDDAVSKTDWAEKFAYADAVDADEGRFAGLAVAQHVNVHRGGVLVHPDRASEQLDEPVEAPEPETDGDRGDDPGVAGATKTRYYARTSLDPVRAVRDLGQIITEVTEHLGAASGGKVEFVIEVSATSDGYDEKTQRTVNENARALGFDSSEFE